MTYPTPRVRSAWNVVLVVGFSTENIKATKKPFKGNWVFDITLRNGKVTNIREYVDIQATARDFQLWTPSSSTGSQQSDP